MFPPIYNNSDWECLAVRKLCFGERLPSKNETTQINEALTKVLCHNFGCDDRVNVRVEYHAPNSGVKRRNDSYSCPARLRNELAICSR